VFLRLLVWSDLMKSKSCFLLVVLVVALLCASCGPTVKKPELAMKPAAVPEDAVGTVGERVALAGLEEVRVQGLGLVTGLNGTGMKVCPPGLRERMLKEISRHKVPHPDQLLSDPNNAVVAVIGVIPPGGRENEHFDLVAMAAPGTDATSLAGGTLLAMDLARVESSRTGAAEGALLAKGEGPIFISPFVLKTDTAPRQPAAGPRPLKPSTDAKAAAPPVDEKTAPATPRPSGEERLQSDPRIGYIFGGGLNRNMRPFFLQLLEPSERTVDQLIRHINARFPDAAKGKMEPTLIDIKVPAEYATDKVHFLEIVMAIYLVDAPDKREQRMQLLANELRQGPDRRKVVPKLEAFGKSSLALLEPLLEDASSDVRYYAAETMARLGSTKVLAALGEFVRDDNSPHQEEAVWALGHMAGGAGSAVLLAGLNAKKSTVRIAVYLTLMQVAPNKLRAVEILQKFQLAALPTRTAPFVFVSRQLQPRVAIFGDVSIEPPLLVDTPRYLATVREGETRIHLVNKSFAGNQTVETSLKLVDIVEAMAGDPEVGPDHPQARALDLSYSDVVGFLDRAFREGAMKAPIVLESTTFAGPGMPSAGPAGGHETDIIIPEK
jgi:hypothetical protein